MARTKQQWFDTLKGWVPQWFFQAEEYNNAVFYGTAEALRLAEADANELIEQTFITEASGAYLDLHGAERGLTRISGELDPSFAIRIQTKSLKSQVAKPDIIAIVDQLLINGETILKEDFEGSIFADRECFVNRSEIILTTYENAFSIVVDKQGDDTVEGIEARDFVLSLILEAVNDNKAFGVLYRIFERSV